MAASATRIVLVGMGPIGSNRSIFTIRESRQNVPVIHSKACCHWKKISNAQIAKGTNFIKEEFDVQPPAFAVAGL
jgi:hypothetical protein